VAPAAEAIAALERIRSREGWTGAGWRRDDLRDILAALSSRNEGVMVASDILPL